MIAVTIPKALQRKARGAKVVTCRMLGGGRMQRIATVRAVRMMERTERLGDTMGAMVREHEQRQATAPANGAAPDPLASLLAEYPPDILCAHLVTEVNGERVSSERASDPPGQDWADDAHPDVLEHVAREVYLQSDLIPETEAQRGEGSGGSSAP